MRIHKGIQFLKEKHSNLGIGINVESEGGQKRQIKKEKKGFRKTFPK